RHPRGGAPPARPRLQRRRPTLAAVREGDRPRAADLRRLRGRLGRHPLLRRRAEPRPRLRRLGPDRRPQPAEPQQPPLGTVPRPPTAGLLNTRRLTGCRRVPVSLLTGTK